jgi:3-oxoacyl-(acyl-carrier-protein) synthase
MWIEAGCMVAFDARLEREAMLQIIDGVGEVFATAAPRARTGLFVVSDNAGTATSLAFWSEALRTGVDVASPALFPWCLANAPCGALARHFHVTGPNATWLGDGEALLAALEAAADALEDARLDAVIVVALEIAKAGGGNALALRMTAAADGPAQAFDAATAREALPSLTLGEAVAALSRQFATALPD